MFRPIGSVHTGASDDDVRMRIRDFQSIIEIYPEFVEGLDGLLGFSHVFVLGYFHKLRSEQKGPLKVKPKGLVKYGFKLEDLPLLGVFALDSPTRPNPIGLSLVPILNIEGRNLIVSGLDYFDGTPVLDIKPYQASYRIENFSLPEWYSKFSRKTGGRV